jgi:hypothetical protein
MQQRTGKVGPMKQESYISTTRVIAVALWITVASLLAAAWFLIFTDYKQVAYMLALTSGVFAPAAAVAHIKVYSMQVTNLIRITAGLGSGVSGPSENTVLHRVH